MELLACEAFRSLEPRAAQTYASCYSHTLVRLVSMLQSLRCRAQGGRETAVYDDFTHLWERHSDVATVQVKMRCWWRYPNIRHLSTLQAQLRLRQGAINTKILNCIVCKQMFLASPQLRPRSQVICYEVRRNDPSTALTRCGSLYASVKSNATKSKNAVLSCQKYLRDHQQASKKRLETENYTLTS